MSESLAELEATRSKLLRQFLTLGNFDPAPFPPPRAAELRNSFIRTDRYSFVQAGVPALAMKFGWTANSPEYKAWRQWLAQRYHSVEDNLSQPVDTAAAQFDSFPGDLARRVANNAERPHYVESSFFHRFEK